MSVASTLVFAHANGYPPGAYQPLLDRLAERFRVLAPEARPLWPGARPEDLRTWDVFVEDWCTATDEVLTDTFLLPEAVSGAAEVAVVAAAGVLVRRRDPQRVHAQVVKVARLDLGRDAGPVAAQGHAAVDEGADVAEVASCTPPQSHAPNPVPLSRQA